MVGPLYRAYPGRAAPDAQLSSRRDRLADGVELVDPTAAPEADLGHAERLAEPLRRMIEAMFDVLLGRRPTEADFDIWAPALKAGISPAECFLAICDSPEARNAIHYPAGLPKSDNGPLSRAVGVAYAFVLRRPPDAAELDRWSERLRAGWPFDALLASLRETATMPALNHAERRSIVTLAYRAMLQRCPAESEVNAWIARLEGGLRPGEMIEAVHGSPEALGTIGPIVGSGLTDAEFVAAAYDIVLQQGITGPEFEMRHDQLASRQLTRSGMICALFNHMLAARTLPPHDPVACWIMGTTTVIDDAGWRAAVLASRERPASVLPFPARFNVISERSVLVSAIASLYRGGKYLGGFLDNITSQTIFKDYAVLIIVDADSPEGEGQRIREVMRDFPNIRYLPINYRIGVYDAWNVGIAAARGAYITNTNLDDLRRADSLEVQAAVLDNLPFVDVTYQDFYYTLDWRMSFDEIARVGLVSDLPIITPHNMFRCNSPHNAPMWRRTLHDELGMFDVTYKSAGDYEFWLRCVAAGKVFYKVNDPHVVYYHNPEGLSTRPDSSGLDEVRRIARRYGRRASAAGAMESKMALAERVLPTGVVLDPAIGERGRYAMVQAGLRHLAIHAKSGRAATGAQA